MIIKMTMWPFCWHICCCLQFLLPAASCQLRLNSVWCYFFFSWASILNCLMPDKFHQGWEANYSSTEWNRKWISMHIYQVKIHRLLRNSEKHVNVSLPRSFFSFLYISIEIYLNRNSNYKNDEEEGGEEYLMVNSWPLWRWFKEVWTETQQQRRKSFHTIIIWSNLLMADYMLASQKTQRRMKWDWESSINERVRILQYADDRICVCVSHIQHWFSFSFFLFFLCSCPTCCHVISLTLLLHTRFCCKQTTRKSFFCFCALSFI